MAGLSWKRSVGALLLLALTGTAEALNSSMARTDCACAALAVQYPDSLILPNASSYDDARLAVWDKRSDQSPSCILEPKKADEVAGAMKTISKCKSTFAVRGGGHMNYPGSNNIDKGVLITFSAMNHTTLTKDKKHIDVGPGSKWVDVYEALDEEHLYTIGGRLKTIGVAGLSLLGGHHYFNNKYGYTMDNIDSYDVVLGNGTQVTATNSTNRDLFWALKGGSGNYGLVTNFRIKVYPIDSVSSVTQTFTEAEIPEYIAALCHFVEYADPSIGAGGVFTLQYSATEDSFSGSMAGIQEGNATDPKQFSNFTAIKSEQKILKVMTPLEWHRTLPDTPYQLFRISFGHHSIKPDVDQLTWLYREWREAVEAVRDVDGLIATFVLNPADASAARVGASNGIGNTWDLPTDQGYVLWQITTAWNREVDDLRMLAWSRSLIERLHAANKAKGLGAEYIYLGDAAEWQRPYTGFHAGNLARMRKIRDVYDPSGVFTKLHWGGFKLGF